MKNHKSTNKSNIKKTKVLIVPWKTKRIQAHKPFQPIMNNNTIPKHTN
jgi:hypothetical protein